MLEHGMARRVASSWINRINRKELGFNLMIAFMISALEMPIAVYLVCVASCDTSKAFCIY